MKIQRLSDKKIFDAVVLPAETTTPAIPIGILPYIEQVGDTAEVFVFTGAVRLVARAGDYILFADGMPHAVLLWEMGLEPQGYRLIAQTQPKK